MAFAIKHILYALHCYIEFQLCALLLVQNFLSVKLSCLETDRSVFVYYNCFNNVSLIEFETGKFSYLMIQNNLSLLISVIFTI